MTAALVFAFDSRVGCPVRNGKFDRRGVDVDLCLGCLRSGRLDSAPLRRSSSVAVIRGGSSVPAMAKVSVGVEPCGGVFGGHPPCLPGDWQHCLSSLDSASPNSEVCLCQDHNREQDQTRLEKSSKIKFYAIGQQFLGRRDEMNLLRGPVVPYHGCVGRSSVSGGIMKLRRGRHSYEKVDHILPLKEQRIS
jgi:hypothetical protein